MTEEQAEAMHEVINNNRCELIMGILADRGGLVCSCCSEPLRTVTKMREWLRLAFDSYDTGASSWGVADPDRLRVQIKCMFCGHNGEHVFRPNPLVAI